MIEVRENLGTGINGFLGSHLAKRIEITPIPHDKIQDLKIGNFENFYFLSAYGNMAHHIEDNKILRANLLDLVAVIQQATGYDFNSFVYVSSSSVKLPVQTMYSRTKEASEKVLLAYMEKYNLPISIVRPFSITGVGEQPQHLIPTLIRSCLEGEQMDFVPGPSHDFIDVEDVVDAMLLLSDRRMKGIYEVGSGIEYTNDQVKDIVEKITGKKANVRLVGRMRSYDNKTWISQNTKMKDLGWRPSKPLIRSITEMVEDYKGGKDAK